MNINTQRNFGNLSINTNTELKIEFIGSLLDLVSIINQISIDIILSQVQV